MLACKRFKAEIAHRLTDSYSKRCQSYHGHSYLFEVSLRSNTLDKNSMVMDFGEVKDQLNVFFDRFDHTMVVSDEDEFGARLVELMQEGNMRYMVVPYNPTAEQMANHAMTYILESPLAMYVESVRVQETLTGWCTVTPDDYNPMSLTDVYYSQECING